MNAIILSVGTELTTGQTIDTNSAYLARQLAERGIHTMRHVTVADDRADIGAAITEACGKAELVIVTGGLGPTEDDLTRQAMADAMGTQLALDERSLAEISEFFRLRNRAMNETNRVQAMIPAGATAIQNRVGTAPGIAAKVRNAQVFVTPGVPSEMEWMYANAIAPLLPQAGGVIVHRIVHTFGAGESDVGARIADLMRRGANPLVGTTVAAGLVSIRIIACAEAPAQAQAMTDAVVAELHRRLGELIVGEGSATLAGTLGEMLRVRKFTVATAESCTGGLIGKLLTDVPGSSSYYIGGVVAYSNAIKMDVLGVPNELLSAHGAVSEEVAKAMAQGCRERLGSYWAVSVTGVAGPDGGTDAKPVGLVWIGVAGPGGVQAHRWFFPGARDLIRLRSAMAAMNYLRLELLKR